MGRFRCIAFPTSLRAGAAAAFRFPSGSARSGFASNCGCRPDCGWRRDSQRAAAPAESTESGLCSREYKERRTCWRRHPADNRHARKRTRFRVFDQGFGSGWARSAQHLEWRLVGIGSCFARREEVEEVPSTARWRCLPRARSPTQAVEEAESSQRDSHLFQKMNAVIESPSSMPDHFLKRNASAPR